MVDEHIDLVGPGDEPEWVALVRHADPRAVVEVEQERVIVRGADLSGLLLGGVSLSHAVLDQCILPPDGSAYFCLLKDCHIPQESEMSFTRCELVDTLLPFKFKGRMTGCTGIGPGRLHRAVESLRVVASPLLTFGTLGLMAVLAAGALSASWQSSRVVTTVREALGRQETMLGRQKELASVSESGVASLKADLEKANAELALLRQELSAARAKVAGSPAGAKRVAFIRLRNESIKVEELSGVGWGVGETALLYDGVVTGAPLEWSSESLPRPDLPSVAIEIMAREGFTEAETVASGAFSDQAPGCSVIKLVG